MKKTSKLRIATVDRSDALDFVRLAVEGATGFAVEPEFQEADRDELVVEVRLTGDHVVDPRLAARAVRDDLPTALWAAGDSETRKGAERVWRLAVPLSCGDGTTAVAVRQRRGYSDRFNVHDATVPRSALAS